MKISTVGQMLAWKKCFAMLNFLFRGREKGNLKGEGNEI